MSDAPEPAGAKKSNFVVQYFKDFSVLKETRSEYWGLQAINALDCFAYFAMFNIVVVMLTDDFGFDDGGAGKVFTIFSALTSIFLFISGLISDWLGIKKSLYLALGGLGITRGLIAYAGAFMEGSSFRSVLVIVALALMAPFMAMLQTVFQSANKRFTTKRSRSAGFNLWYMFMNVGALLGGLIVDYFYLDLKLPRYHILTFGVVTAVLTIIISLLTIHHTEQLYGPGEEPEPEPEKKEKKSIIELAKSVLKESAFWRFVVLITLLLGVRAVFLYLSLLHPKFWIRVIGPEAKIGAMQAFNPFFVIIGLILLIPILEKFNVYKMLIVGAMITSLSMFIMAIPNSAGTNEFILNLYNSCPTFLQEFFTDFVGVQIQGNEIVYFTYFTSICFLVVLTLGELIWSPRLTEYTAAIAPKGQEGTYLGLSVLPYFIAKFAISWMSGAMLMRWCAEPPKENPLYLQQQLNAGNIPYEDSPYMMFLILGFIAIAGTVLAIIGKPWFTKGANFDKKDNDAPKAEESETEESKAEIAAEAQND